MVLFSSPEFWTLLGTVAVGIIGYITVLRKNRAEAKGIEVNNDKEILNTYKTELEYFSKQLELTRNEISALREEISNERSLWKSWLSEQIKELKDRFRTLYINLWRVCFLRYYYVLLHCFGINKTKLIN